MKKVLILLLAISVILCLAACGDKEESSEATSSATSEASKETSKEESKAESKEASSEEPQASSEEEPSEESSEESGEESGEPGIEVADFITQYVSFGNTIEQGLTGARNTDATSVRVTGVNEGAVDGVASVLVFNSNYGKTIDSADGSYDDYAVYVLEYNEDTYHYEMTESYKVEDTDKDSVKIPADGFVLAIHSHFEKYIKAVNGVEKGHAFYPHGFRGTDDVDALIKKQTAKVDGSVTEKEYGTLVWDINPDETIIGYGQFEDNNYYSTAKAYLCYDDEFLYLGVVVSSPYHNNSLTQESASGMWQYECIQVNVTSVSPSGDYIFENWDNIVNAKAVNDGVVRQYGFAANDNGDTIYCVWMPGGGIFSGETVCVRDDDAQTTTYEAKIPWSEIGGEGNKVDVKKGTEIGVSVSINSGNNTFKNIILRDGGGIIGLNDWSKVPTITLN